MHKPFALFDFISFLSAATSFHAAFVHVCKALKYNLRPCSHIWTSFLWIKIFLTLPVLPQKSNSATLTRKLGLLKINGEGEKCNASVEASAFWRGKNNLRNVNTVAQIKNKSTTSHVYGCWETSDASLRRADGADLVPASVVSQTTIFGSRFTQAIISSHGFTSVF